jgi:hypothetical protein
MPSSPSLQACSNMLAPISPSMCGLSWMPSPVQQLGKQTLALMQRVLAHVVT